MRLRIARFAMGRRATAVGALIMVFVMAGTALAVGPGATFKLGVVNSISGYVTTLTGSNNGAMLAIKNTNTNSGSKGLSINVPAGKPPIVVNGTAGKATGLNADKVDGKNASAFLPAGGKALDAYHADTANTVGGYSANGLIRVAYASGSFGGTLPTYPTESTGLTVTIVAPSAGFVVVTANQNFQQGACNSGGSCIGFARLRHNESGALGQWSLATAPSTGNGWAAAAMTAVFPVNAGTNSFDIRVSRDGAAAGNVNGFYNQMSALFSPFGSTGAGTLGSSSSATFDGNPARR